MEEQSSWKGHTFTLMIFGGIVVLCSIFFVLGMLVGRTQSQKLAAVDAPPSKTAGKDASKDDRPELSFYDAVDKKQPSSEPISAKPEPLPFTPAPVVKEDPAHSPALPVAAVKGDSYQVGAFEKQQPAEKLLAELKKRGFARAFILAPSPSDAKPLYKVQVGPMSDPLEAESTRQKLVSAGYPALKK